MKLDTRTRKRIRTAAGKPVEITWPQTEDAPECKAGSKYPVYTDNGLAFRIRVVSHEGEKAIVRIDHDSVRRLPGLSGQRNEDGDYEDEPERVPASYEQLLSSEARTRHAELRSESQRRQRERGVQRRLREAMSGLDDNGQVELLAKLEREIKEATKGGPNGPKGEGKGPSEQRLAAGAQAG